MLFNKRVDSHTDPLVDTHYFNEVLNGNYDDIYVTFIAMEEETSPEAWQEGEESFLMVALPYAELSAENARQIMLEKLLEGLKLLRWKKEIAVREFVERALKNKQRKGYFQRVFHNLRRLFGRIFSR